jgi:hypothetical protein
MLDDKSFVDTYKDKIIEAAYNAYEDEYDDTYDTSAIQAQGVDLNVSDELDEESHALNERQYEYVSYLMHSLRPMIFASY